MLILKQNVCLRPGVSPSVTYVGEWKDGYFHGKGLLMHGDGETYEGMFDNDYIHGYGKYTGPQGASYEGEWKQNMHHGFGEYTWANGDKYVGHFWHHAMQGDNETIILNKATGQITYIGAWRNNIPVGVQIELKQGATKNVCINVNELGLWMIEYWFSHCSS